LNHDGNGLTTANRYSVVQPKTFGYLAKGLDDKAKQEIAISSL